MILFKNKVYKFVRLLKTWERLCVLPQASYSWVKCQEYAKVLTSYNIHQLESSECRRTRKRSSSRLGSTVFIVPKLRTLSMIYDINLFTLIIHYQITFPEPSSFLLLFLLYVWVLIAAIQLSHSAIRFIE